MYYYRNIKQILVDIFEFFYNLLKPGMEFFASLLQKK